ncbi:MAG: hypothetical protein B6245_22565 [Desulfobacteraceae bacterium 4572_88]|nr:MAG: hypothetical protein B6245_22565 [Desulfobacteraceae bacterium 4572_88]
MLWKEKSSPEVRTVLVPENSGKATWLNVMEIQDPARVFLLHELDRGEAEVIILAQEQKINQVIIDERVARMHASVAGLIGNFK